MVVTYLPEPILSEAACQSLHSLKAGLAFWSHHLADNLFRFFDKCLNGLILAGEIEGVLARGILSLAFDVPQIHLISMMNQKTFFSEPLKLTSYMDSLIDTGYKAMYERKFKCSLFKMPAGLGDAEICFTNWATLHDLPKGALSEEYLQMCFERRAAVILPSNKIDADFLIPLRIPQANSPMMDELEPIKYRYSFIIVQVKNWVEIGPDRLIYAGQDLSYSNCFADSLGSAWSLEYLAIYMELGDNSFDESFGGISVSQAKDFSSAYPNHLMLVGLNYPFFDDNSHLKTVFSVFNRHHVEFVNASKRLNTLQRVAPLSYFYSSYECQCKSCCTHSECACYSQNRPCGPACYCCVGGDGSRIAVCNNLRKPSENNNALQS